MNEEVLIQGVQLGKKGGKKASEALDQKLAKAVRDGQSPEEIAGLINTPHAKGTTVLHRACENGDPDTLHVLLKHGGSPNVRREDGVTPLLHGLCAIGRGGRDDPPATKPVVKKYERLCSVLLEHPSFDCEANLVASSPVLQCVRKDLGRADALLPLLKLLLARGFDASVESRADDGASGTPLLPALHMAISNGHFKCAAALVDAGADTDVKAAVVSPGGDSTPPLTALELCDSLGEKDLLSELRRLASTHKATAKVLAEQSRPSGAGNGSAPEPELATAAAALDDDVAARIREEAKAELKRRKNKEKKKKKKEQEKAKAQELQARQEEEAQAGPATGFRVRAGGGGENDADVVPAYESLLDPLDIEIVMEQARCGAVSRERAVQALANHNGDAVEAILELEGAIDSRGQNLLLAPAAAATDAASVSTSTEAGQTAAAPQDEEEAEGTEGSVNGYGVVAYDLAAEAQRLRAARMTQEAVGWEAGGSINPQGKDRPPPVAMKRNPVTGEMEEFHSEKLKDDLPDEEAESCEVEIPVGDDY